MMGDPRITTDDGHNIHEDDNEPGSDHSDSPTATVEEELRPEQVRWFYKKNSRQKIWDPLNGRDSLTIEKAYRRHQALRKQSKGKQKDQKLEEDQIPEWAKTAVAFDDSYGLYYKPADTTKTSVIQVASNSVEIAHHTRFPYRLKPLYWQGSDVYLARGTWFLETSGGVWQPLSVSGPDLVQRIEEQHLKMFAHQPIPVRPKNAKPPFGTGHVICELVDADEQKRAGSGVRVLWYALDDIRLYNYSQSTRLWRLLRLSTAGTRLMRGYKTEAQANDGPPLTTDLVFVIHGIGEKKKRSRIERNAAGLRETAERLLKKYYPGRDHHPLFLPVDWRSDLKLDEHTIASLTPAHYHDIRAFFNDNLMDLMYYASPVHGPKITQNLSDVLNRMLQTFTCHDPTFYPRNGRVSLLAHSLGSVLAYDILSMEGCAVGPPRTNDRISIQTRANPQTSRLIFPVHHLFIIGAPLGIFLAGRHVRGQCILHPPGGAPTFRLHNLYHPADSVAYRIEPLVSEVYAEVRPLIVHKTDARERLAYEGMPTEPLLSTKIGKDGKKETIEIPTSIALPYRIDHELQVSRGVSKYLTAIRAHYQYWQNPDVIMYVLMALYGPPQSTAGSSSPKAHELKK